MGKVFISYRRDDAAGYARAIYEELTERFPPDRIFMDVDAIEPGLPFDEVIRNAVGQCEVLLVLIGLRWLAPQPDGRTRLDDERDFVRLEIGAALARNIRVIPVLLDGVQMPKEAELPEALRGLVWRNAIEVSNTRFRADVERLANVLARVLDGPAATDAVDARPPAPQLAPTPAAATESAALAARKLSATQDIDDAKGRTGARGKGVRYVAGLALLAAAAALAWLLWPGATPSPVQGPEMDPQAESEAMQRLLDQVQRAQMDQVRRLGQAGSEMELDPLGSLDFGTRPWGVVFASGRSLEAARDELRRASLEGVEQAAIYLRNDYYASIALRAERAQADRVLGIVRTFSSDAYVADMRTWCLRPQPHEGYVACGAAQAN